MNDKLTILLVSDTGYLPYVSIFINSLYQNSNLTYLKLHIYLVNVSSDNKYINNIINDAKIPVSLTYDNIVLPDGMSIKRPVFNKTIGYYCNIRIKAILNMLKAEVKYIFYIDVDSLIRRDLTKLFTIIKNNELTFRIIDDKYTAAKNTKYYMPVKTGAIGIKHTANTIKFFEEFHKLLNENNYLEWGDDQEYLYVLYKKYIITNIISFKELNKSFLDWNFKEKSHIWTAKGNRKNNNIYLNELDNYLKNIDIKDVRTILNNYEKNRHDVIIQ